MPLPLFDVPALPEGFVYRAGFIDDDEEEALLRNIRQLSSQHPSR